MAIFEPVYGASVKQITQKFKIYNNIKRFSIAPQKI